MAERGFGQALGMPQCSSATPRHNTVHNMEIFSVLFCLVFSLLRGLVYWTNEDLISV